MAVVSRLETTNVFADDSTAKITIDNIYPDNLNLANIRNSVIQFNAAQGGTLASKMKSKHGFDWVAIKKVQIVTTDKEVIF